MDKVIDRVPTYAGRIQLIPVDAEHGIYDVVRADEPTVVGTPINAELFQSIADDLEKIAPPILAAAECIANSKNVAFYTSLDATGLVSDGSVTTDTFFTSTLPLNCGVFCTITSDAEITLNDLPSQHGTLLMVKGEVPANRSGIFWPADGGIYVYMDGEWLALATRRELEVSTTDLSVNWTDGKIIQTLSDGTMNTMDMEFDADGIPTKIGDMNITISGVM